MFARQILGQALNPIVYTSIDRFHEIEMENLFFTTLIR
ncbi:hypothetical protein LEP1GSC059_2580 [Leptospira noguchii serovar Panama str. CZ214]|uniref:Uncharacterized protein n=1 Tax=Leptospira noguchii serovar Panama str. CZ214 TaxID=1001595 RepID=T0FP56_9LEPT|nr:hypothetical protein LEP1GSC059_2580 [Leptospira noguchii serovar Panama str. CZ214]